MGLTSHLRSAWESLRKEQDYGFCDGLRALSVLWVCADHALLCFELLVAGMGARLYKAWFPIAFPAAGAAGVDVFLVLSGFLIGGALQRETSRTGGIAVGKFVVRRVFRIFPAIFSAMLFTMLGDYLAGARQECPNSEWFLNLFLFNNLPVTKNLLCMGHTWSVSLELQLYMATPAFFMIASLVSSRMKIERVTLARCMVLLCILSWLACCALRLHFVFSQDLLQYTSANLLWLGLYLPTQYRFSTYVAGVLVGVLVQARKESHAPACKGGPLTTALLAMAFLVVASVSFVGCDVSPATNSAGAAWYRANLPTVAALHAALFRPCFGAAVASIVLQCSSGSAPRVARFLSLPVWRPLAGLSYSMYLLQFVGFRLMAKPYLLAISSMLVDSPLWLGTLAAFACVALFVLAAIPLALFNYTFVEIPGINVGRYVVEKVAGSRRGIAPRSTSVEKPQLAHRSDLANGKLLDVEAGSGPSEVSTESPKSMGRSEPASPDGSLETLSLGSSPRKEADAKDIACPEGLPRRRSSLTSIWSHGRSSTQDLEIGS